MSENDIATNIRALIHSITGFEPDTETFHALETQTLSTIKKCNNPLYMCRNDITDQVNKIAEKFEFHSFFKHATCLKRCYAKYVPETITGSDLITRLNVIKMCLELTERPTEHFWNCPDRFKFVEMGENAELDETPIDWGAYLKEDILLESFPTDSESELSDDATSFETPPLALSASSSAPGLAATAISIQDLPELYNFRESRLKLDEIVQDRDWWQTRANDSIESDHFEAQVALKWQHHVETITGGLVPLTPIKLISEYKVLREIIWQLFKTHASVVFQLRNNKGGVQVRPHVTIPSVRQGMFRSFLDQHFVPYIEMLADFRLFSENLKISMDDSWQTVPSTLRCYSNGVDEIIASIWPDLIELEAEIRGQNTTMTLIKMANRLLGIFKPIVYLKKIHDYVTRDLGEMGPLEAGLELISRLRSRIQHTFSIVDENIRLTLYLATIRHYFRLIETLLVNSHFVDYTGEFPIENKNTINTTDCVDDQVNMFKRHGIEAYYEKDGLIDVIGTKVLILARNLQLLRYLRKYEHYSHENTIYEQFLAKIIAELANFNEIALNQNEIVEQLRPEPSDTELDDGFLDQAFDHQLSMKTEPSPTLYDQIRAYSKRSYPLRDLPQRILTEILDERFTISCLSVKNQLIEKFAFDKQLALINEVFLFEHNLMFLFTRSLFNKKRWSSDVTLTSHLHDAILDHFPDVYQNVWISIVGDKTNQNFDSLRSLDAISINYDLRWPLNLIVVDGDLVKYKKLFGFLLRIKWALHALMALDAKLKRKELSGLRFLLISLFNSMQLYVLPIFDANRKGFELDMEKANNLQEIIGAHSVYIDRNYALFEAISGTVGVMDALQLAVDAARHLVAIWDGEGGVKGVANVGLGYKNAWNVLNDVINSFEFKF